MKPKKIPVWLARDKDKYKETYLWLQKPEFDEECMGYRLIGGEWAMMPKHYGLKPGEMKEAYLVIEEE